MKSVFILRIYIGFVFSIGLIGMGAYNTAIGNVTFARSLFTWGIISTVVSILWLFVYLRNKKVNRPGGL